MRFKISFLVLLMLLAAACGPAPAPDTDATEATAASAESVADGAAVEAPADEAAADAAAEPATRAIPDYDSADIAVTDSGLQYVIFEQGDGAQPAAGDRVQVQYTGWLEDGTEFDSSIPRGAPFSFAIGDGSVIAGWDEGISLLNEGGRALLIVPAELGYGAGGRGVIPANATLLFEVELVSVQAAPKPQVVDEADYAVTDGGVKYHDLVVGDGATPEPGQVVSFDFTVWLDSGVPVASSDDNNRPLAFALGQGQMLPAIDEGVTTMRVGGVRQLVLTPEQSSEGGPPQEDGLILELELIAVTDGSPAAPQSFDEADFQTTENGIRYYDFEVGSGPTPTQGQTVVVHYTGWLEDGTKFDSSLDRAVPLEFPLGTPNIIPGWNEGLSTMQVGGQRQIIIPPDQAYGESGAGGAIPPNATLIFEVELIDIR